MLKHGRYRGLRWELAPALDELLDQVDCAHPGRSKRSDGSIPSAAHHKANPRSDHEPRLYGGRRLVTAIDITHNVQRGLDCRPLFEALKDSEDKRIKYVIFQAKIFNSPGFGTAGAKKRGPWRPGPYTGPNKHMEHIHVSVWGQRATDDRPWSITLPPPAGSPSPVGKSAVDLSALTSEDAEFLHDFVKELKKAEAKPSSLRHVLRFYRRLAIKSNKGGDYPVDVADWVAARPPLDARGKVVK